ncbi:MAG: SIS domain-containing protein [Candidatus Limnocylindrales bacterium]
MAVVQPIAADYQQTLRVCLDQRARAEALAYQTVAAGLRNLFLVGCGGSAVAMYPTQYLFERASARVPVSLLTSGEFVWRHPASLGPGSLVIVASHTGTTAETLDAARVAREAGATIAAVTRSPESPLAGLADVPFVYGSEDTVTDAKYVLIGQLGLATLSRLGELRDYTGATRAYDALPDALHAARLATEATNHEIAQRLQDAAITYVVASGPAFGAAYLLAMCFLQEMQWMHAAAFNAGEFLHGAMEVVIDDVPVVVLLGEDETRPMAERVQAFARRYTQRAISYDSRDLSLPGVPDAWRSLVSPIALSGVVTRLASHLEAVRDHSLDLRRYMSKVSY